MLLSTGVSSLWAYELNYFTFLSFFREMNEFNFSQKLKVCFLMVWFFIPRKWEPFSVNRKYVSSELGG